MPTYRNTVTGELRTFTAAEARDRNKNRWVLVTDIPKPPRKTTRKPKAPE